MEDLQPGELNVDPRHADVIGDFVTEAQAHLEPLLEVSGEVLFSAANTLKEGDLYICGLNPGGVGDAPHHHTIREDLRMLPHKTSNNYLDEWQCSKMLSDDEIKSFAAAFNYPELRAGSNYTFFHATKIGAHTLHVPE